MLDKTTHSVFWETVTMGLHLQNKMNLHSRHLKIFSPNVVFIALKKGLVYKLECIGYIYYF